MTNNDAQTQMEAAAFRRLVKHLQNRTDVQNIDIMNLAGFCRNCMSKWYLSAGKELNQDMSYEDALEYIYGMPYDNWKGKYQTKASNEQIEKFNATKPLHAKIEIS